MKCRIKTKLTYFVNAKKGTKCEVFSVYLLILVVGIIVVIVVLPAAIVVGAISISNMINSRMVFGTSLCMMFPVSTFACPLPIVLQS